MKRDDQLEAAFLEGGLNVPGLQMRPFSIGTLNLCKKMKLSMFVSDEDKKEEGELSEDDSLEQLTAFAWMQSQPLKDVLAAVRENRWREAVEVFSFSLSAETIGSLTSEITRISGQSNAAAVEVVKKPGEASDEKDAPPNS